MERLFGMLAVVGMCIMCIGGTFNQDDRQTDSPILPAIYLRGCSFICQLCVYCTHTHFHSVFLIL